MTDDLRRESTEQRIKGTAESVKGKVKETAGEIVDREDWEAEGRMDQVKGKLRDTVGRAGQALSDTVDDVMDRDRESDR